MLFPGSGFFRVRGADVHRNSLALKAREVSGTVAGVRTAASCTVAAVHTAADSTVAAAHTGEVAGLGSDALTKVNLEP